MLSVTDAQLLIKAALHRSWSYSFAKKCLYIQIYDADTTREVTGIELDADGLPILDDTARSFLRAAIAAEELP
jgi:hypothetical protein